MIFEGDQDRDVDAKPEQLHVRGNLLHEIDKQTNSAVRVNSILFSPQPLD